MTSEEQRRLGAVEQRVLSHEAHCAERWEMSRKAMENLSDNVAEIKDIVSQAQGAVKGGKFALWAAGIGGGGVGAAMIKYLLPLVK